MSYSYQRVRVKDLNPLYSQAAVLANNPFLADSLLTNQGGERRISKIGPSYITTPSTTRSSRPLAAS